MDRLFLIEGGLLGKAVWGSKTRSLDENSLKQIERSTDAIKKLCDEGLDHLRLVSRDLVAARLTAEALRDSLGFNLEVEPTFSSGKANRAFPRFYGSYIEGREGDVIVVLNGVKDYAEYFARAICGILGLECEGRAAGERVSFLFKQEEEAYLGFEYKYGCELVKGSYIPFSEAEEKTFYHRDWEEEKKKIINFYILKLGTISGS